MPGANFSPYLPPNAKEQLSKYVYHGTDHSLIYQKGWKPLCAWLVNKLPRWLAPNVITVTALIIVIITHTLLVVYMPGMEPVEGVTEVPGYVFVLTAVGLLLYQLLDNVDGHQARRLGVSSPLGLLMDHGCDAFNCVVGSLSLACAVNCGPTWKTWIVLVGTATTFFMNTWEEYYRGALILPIINGANEGILVAVGLYILTAVNGVTWWRNVLTFPSSSLPPELHLHAANATLHEYLGAAQIPSYLTDTLVSNLYTPEGDMQVMYNTLAVWLLTVSVVLTSLGNVWNVFWCTRAQSDRHGRYGDGWMVSNFPFLHSLTRLLPLAAVFSLANIWFIVSPDGIFAQHPRLFCWTVGLLFTKLAIHLMIAHLCSVEFHPFRRTMVPFFFLAAHIAFTYINTRQFPMIDERLVLLEFLLLSSTTFAHLAINCISETARALKVNIFTVPKAKQS